jgi:hypothetical protein
MRSKWLRGVPGVVAGVVLLVGALPASAQGWGTVKGQVVWDGAVPKRKPLDVTQDKAHCLSKGPILSEEVVVNPKNKGVRWAVVYLVDLKDANKDLPIHPSLQKVPAAKVEIDQPCCAFEPRVVTVRVGQTLLIKNSSPVPHNSNVSAPVNKNPLIPPGKSEEIPIKEGKLLPIPVSCSIHGWMKAWVFACKHPYCAVTDENGRFTMRDAPEGKYRLIVWQENVGWLDGVSPLKGGGKVIDIKGLTNVGKLELKP